MGTTARATTDLDEFLDLVDIVGFAVPPEAQVSLASLAIESGKHLLLEKPVALHPVDADMLVKAARTRNVRTLVFFTRRFSPAFADWLAESRESPTWVLGRVESFGSTLVDAGDASHGSPWRQAGGALWDVGPHAVAQLCGALGRVTTVLASRGPGDLMSLLLTHESGAQGIISLAGDISSPVSGATYLVGSRGRVSPPAVTDWTAMARESYGEAIAQLANEIEHGTAPHACTLEFGAHVTRVLSAAERSAESARVEVP